VFFVASKVFWMFLSPIVVLLVLALVGASWCGDRWRRTFRSIGIAAILILITVAMTPLGLMAAAPLENRFPQPAADIPPPFGIIVLGGAVNGLVTKARGKIVFDEGERMIEAAFLAKRYPQARVVFTGGSGSLIGESKEAPAARELLIKLGVDPARIIVEDKSRNTEENAQFTAAIVRPEPKQRWLLVTSAFHMPRAIGVFEKAGFDVVADPVAYRTLGPGTGGNGTWALEADSGFSRPRCTNGSASPYTGQPEGSIVCSRGPGLPEAFGNALLGRLQDTARHSRSRRKF
jgi:uncharacterized SAM-binding protein YcdF (DUF218 family)